VRIHCRIGNLALPCEAARRSVSSSRENVSRPGFMRPGPIRKTRARIEDRPDEGISADRRVPPKDGDTEPIDYKAAVHSWFPLDEAEDRNQSPALAALHRDGDGSHRELHREMKLYVIEKSRHAGAAGASGAFRTYCSIQ
jgi:hypothetical protein